MAFGSKGFGLVRNSLDRHPRTPEGMSRGSAEKAAKRVYGVKGVANDIAVKPLWQRIDPEIARDAVHELESHVSIPADMMAPDQIISGRPSNC